MIVFWTGQAHFLFFIFCPFVYALCHKMWYTYHCLYYSALWWLCWSISFTKTCFHLLKCLFIFNANEIAFNFHLRFLVDAFILHGNPITWFLFHQMHRNKTMEWLNSTQKAFIKSNPKQRMEQDFSLGSRHEWRVKLNFNITFNRSYMYVTFKIGGHALWPHWFRGWHRMIVRQFITWFCNLFLYIKPNEIHE